MSAHAFSCIRRRVARVRQGRYAPQLVALFLWCRRSALRAFFLRLSALTRPSTGCRALYLPRAIRRRRYARAARVSRDRECALTRLARLSRAVGISNPSPRI